jgi:hypothetical protein
MAQFRVEFRTLSKKICFASLVSLAAGAVQPYI